MNAVYKLIFNVSTGTWAVASELTSSRGKKSRTRLAAAMVVALALPAGAALAADSPEALQCAVGQSISADGLRCEIESVMAPMSGGIGTMAAPDGTNIQINNGGRAAAGAVGSGAIAIGNDAQANGANAISMGYWSRASSIGAVGIGSGSNALADSSVALGRSSSVDAAATDAVALGHNSVATEANTVSIGNATTQRKLVNMAAGTADTDAVNLGQMNTGLATKVDNDYVKVGGGQVPANLADNTGRAGNIAIGSNARATTISANSAGIALGENALSNAAGSVALGTDSSAIGSGSVAIGLRAAATASRAIALGQDSVADEADTVSVGNATLRRKLVNMAAGTAATDAVNVSQLAPIVAGLGGDAAINPTTGVVTGPTYNIGGTSYNNVGGALGNLDGRVNTLESSGVGPGLVERNTTTGEITVAKDLEGGAVNLRDRINDTRLLKGVRTGVDRTDAANVGQLVDNSTVIATALGGGAAANPVTGLVSAPTYAIGDGEYHDVGAAFGAVDTKMDGIDDRTQANSEGLNTVTNITNNLMSGTAGIVKQAAAGANLTVGAETDGAAVDFTGTAGERTLSGVAAGELDTDAANVGQLKGTAQSVADAIGGNSIVNADGTITAPVYNIGGDDYTGIGDAFAGVDDNLTDINSRMDGLADGTAGIVTYDAVTGTVKVASAQAGDTVDFANNAGEARTLSNVAAGTAATDAANVGQLKGTAQSVADAIGGNSVVNADGTISAPSYEIDGTTITNIGDALTNLDGRTTTNTGNINDLTTVVNDLSSGAAGLVTIDSTTGNVNVATGNGGTAVNFAGTEGARRLGGVANGVEDDEAATIAQLKASGLVDPNDGRALGAVVYDDVDLGRATLGGTNGTVLGNVGNGLIGAGSMEAINGGQLWQMNADWESKWSALDGRVGTIEQGIADGSIGGPGNGGGAGGGAGDGIVAPGEGAGSVVIGDGAAGGAGAIGIGDGSSAAGDGSVAIGEGASAPGKDSVAIGSGSTTDRDREVSVGAPGAERVISNVAAGTRPTDAVNLKQMDDRFAAERDWSNSRFQAVDKRIDRMGAISAAYAGMAMNTAGLSGENRVGAGIGQQNGRSALAVGYQRVMGVKQNVSVSLGGAFSGSDKSMSAGAGYSW